MKHWLNICGFHSRFCAGCRQMGDRTRVTETRDTGGPYSTHHKEVKRHWWPLPHTGFSLHVHMLMVMNTNAIVILQNTCCISVLLDGCGNRCIPSVRPRRTGSHVLTRAVDGTAGSVAPIRVKTVIS